MSLDELRFGSARSRALLVLSFMFIALVVTGIVTAGDSRLPVAPTQPVQQMRVLVPITGIERSTPTPTARMAVPGVANIPQQANCTYTSQYWVDNPSAWLTEYLVVGNLTYSKDQALHALADPNPRLPGQLLKQFITAALNLLHGADAQVVDLNMRQASDWLNRNLNNPIISLEDIDLGTSLLIELESYNHGSTGPALCSDSPPPATPLPTATLTPVPTATPLFRLAASPSPSNTSRPGPSDGVSPSSTPNFTPSTASTTAPVLLPNPSNTSTPQPTSPPLPSSTPANTSFPTSPSEPTSPPTSTPHLPDPTNTPRPPDPSNTPRPPDPTNTPRPPDPTNTPQPPEPTNTEKPPPTPKPSNTLKPTNTPKPSNTPKPL